MSHAASSSSPSPAFGTPARPGSGGTGRAGSRGTGTRGAGRAGKPRFGFGLVGPRRDRHSVPLDQLEALALPVGDDGMVIGVDAESRPAVLGINRPVPYDITLIGGLWTAQVLALRAGGPARPRGGGGRRRPRAGGARAGAGRRPARAPRRAPRGGP
ncbi:hypothetical protein ACFV0D_32105, partial [Streptomyces sp. NPDC059556]